jgi:O-antigen ligase
MSVLTYYAQDRATPKLIVVARMMIYLGIFCTMLCTPILNKAFWAASLCIFLSGEWLKNWRILRHDKIVIAGLVLILLLALSLVYTHTSWHLGLRAYNKYLKIFYLLLFLPFFTAERARTQAIYLLLASVMVGEIFPYLHFFKLFVFDYPITKHWLFVQDLDASYIVSFACYTFANLAVENKKYRWLWIACLIVCSFDILFLNVERTGYVIYLALGGLFLWQRFKWKGFLAALMTIPLLFGILYLSSQPFHHRISQIASNLSDYKKGNQITSIGLRLVFVEYSLKMIQGHWLTGVGVGSFEKNYQALSGPRMNEGTYPRHPHDEYLHMLLQIGVVGLIVFIGWLIFQFQASFMLPQREKFFLQGLLLGFVLLSFFNASLSVNPAGACYITFLAVFLAARFDVSNQQLAKKSYESSTYPPSI